MTVTKPAAWAVRAAAAAAALGLLGGAATALPETSPAPAVTDRPASARETCQLVRVGHDVMQSPSLDVQCGPRIWRMTANAKSDLKPVNAQITGWRLQQVRVWPLNDRSGATITWWVQTSDGTRQVGTALVCADRARLPVDGLCVGPHAQPIRSEVR